MGILQKSTKTEPERDVEVFKVETYALSEFWQTNFVPSRDRDEINEELENELKKLEDALKNEVTEDVTEHCSCWAQLFACFPFWERSRYSDYSSN